MSHWFWYVARDDELMMDCDGRVLLEIAQSRIQRDGFPVKQTYVVPSQTPDHFHFVVQLQHPMEVTRRMVLQLYLMDHVYRSVKNLLRVLDGVRSPSLLVSPEDWQETPRLSWNGNGEQKCIHFWREFDASCRCPANVHKNPALIYTCPAHDFLRGPHNNEAPESL